jgi:hypothetical protein
MRTSGGLVVVLLVSGCLEVTVPPRTPVGPGSLRATLLTALPNRPDLAPAEGAKVTLVGSTLTATADADGNVTLSGLRQRSGRVVFSFDVDRDGTEDRTRLVTLETVGAGLGKDVNLGTLVLGRNATVIGSVKRGDRRELSSGHGGITVFLPQLPQLTTTGDDGTFVMPGVPEGNLVLNAFAPGYRTEVSPLVVSAGAELRVAPLVLEAAPGAAPVGALRGRIEEADGTPVAAVTVQVAAGGMELRAETSAEGRFAFETLPVGVYSLGASKASYVTLRVPTVLVTAGVTDLGVLVLTSGTSTPVSLDGGPLIPDAGAGGGAAGGMAGGMAGGSAGGAAGGAAGGSAGGSSGGIAGGAAGGSAGGSAGGAAGGSAGGTTMGPAPVAIVGPPQVIVPGRPVRLDGVQSQGDPPLTYSWTQLVGPPVTLSDNNSPSAEDPLFTAPGLGSVVEFSLVVTDRFGRSSTNLAVARVSSGGRPVARFVPDGGVLVAGVPTPLQSLSTDDGGLPLLTYSWTLTPGSAATLSTDGGSAALLLPTALPFGSPDGLAEVTLEVTNSIGARSAPFSRVFAIRAANPNNWTLDAGPQGSLIEVFDASTVVSLEGAFQTSLAAPAPAFSWVCTPAQTLLAPTSLNASFVAPIVVGPDVQVACSVTGAAASPYAPASLTATAYLTLRDRIPPRIIRGLAEPTRLGPFGVSFEFDEDVDGAGFAFCAGGEIIFPYVIREDPRIIAFRNNTGPFVEGGLCTVSSTATDRSPSLNALTYQVRTNAVFQTIWNGPYLSTAAFADPRPVLASLGTYPKAQQRRWNAPNPRPAPTQLLVSDGDGLMALGFDAYAPAACVGSPCPLATGASVPLGLSAGAPPRGQRTFWSGATMFVAVRPDLFAERSPSGTWSVAPPMPGSLMQAGTFLRAVSQDGGVLNLWTRTETSSSFVFSEFIASGVAPLAEVVGNGDRLVATTASAPRTMRTWDRVGVTWAERPLSVAPVDAGTLVYADIGRGPAYGTITSLNASGPYTTYRSGVPGFSGEPFVSPFTTTSFHAASQGAVLYVAAVEGGLLRLFQNPWNNLSLRTTVPGPPRPGITPTPEPLNIDLACEAAAPHLTFIEDSLVITWQERCPPQTLWRVAVRVMR